MRWQNFTLSGSPPCSPQMPIFSLSRVLRPFSTASFISAPTPSWSMVAKGSAARMSARFGSVYAEMNGP